MVGVSFAAVPFYYWFCRTTGFGGTTQVAKAAAGVRSRRARSRCDFDSNVAAGLPWSFEPERRTIDVRLGEVVTVYYKVINEAARVTLGQAGYNVSPPTVGIYFEKINCFCFTEQTLKPGENARHGGGLLRRSEARSRIPSRTISTPSRSPTRSIRGANRTSRWRRAQLRKLQGISEDGNQPAQTATAPTWR